MSYALQYHEMMRVIIHLDKDNNILGLELPESVLKEKHVKQVGMVPPTAECMCTKGLKGCVKEIKSKEIHVIVSCQWENTRFTSEPQINYVRVGENTLAELTDEKLNDEDFPCQEFDPIHANYNNIYRCMYCSLVTSCMHADVDVDDFCG